MFSCSTCNKFHHLGRQRKPHELAHGRLTSTRACCRETMLSLLELKGATTTTATTTMRIVTTAKKTLHNSTSRHSTSNQPGKCAHSCNNFRGQNHHYYHKIESQTILACKRHHHLYSNGSRDMKTFKSCKRPSWSRDDDNRMAKNSLVNLTTILRAAYTSSLSPLIILALLIFVCSVVTCLDSPAKIQRNKHQLQTRNSTSRPDFKQLDDSHYDKASEHFLNLNNRIDRVRRTNSEPNTETNSNTIQNNNNLSQPFSKQQVTSSQVRDECPSNRLLQALLPPEYLGSPATSQRPALARAHCDCTADLFGWHLTCFAASSAFPIQSNGSGAGSRAAVSIASSMPNQLHPAFRGPQMARQQQAINNQASRRIKRSSAARWLGDDEPDVDPSSLFSTPKLHRSLKASTGGDETIASANVASNVDEISSHDGFGEETPLTSTVAPRIATATGLSSSDLATFITSMNTTEKQLHKRMRHNQQAQAAINSRQGVDTNRRYNDISNENNVGHVDDAQEDPVSNGKENYETNRSNSSFSTDSNIGISDKLSLFASGSSNHLTFQTVPILFSVKYSRNNMIEIDCDQAAPHFKAAMFQGFNVNEISSFTFNNCQLPAISYAVLLHRTRPLASVSSSGLGANGPGDGGTGHLSAAATATGSSGGSNSGRSSQASHSLKPNRLKHQSLFNRRRRRQANQLEPSISRQMAPGTIREPRVRSLTVNLNTIVDQRTLISLLTGLDHLEELQLNYMQLNLTGFINQYQQRQQFDGSLDLTSIPSGASSVSNGPLATSSTTTDELVATPSITSHHSAPMASSPGTTSTTSTTTTTTTTTVAPIASVLPSSGQTLGQITSSRTTNLPNGPQTMPQTVASTGAIVQPSTGTTSSASVPRTVQGLHLVATVSPPTTTHATSAARRFQQNHQTTNGIGAAAAAAAVAATTTTTTVTTSSTSANNNGGQTFASTNLLKPMSGSASTRPPISMGAPRGLIIAQATGLPPTSSNQNGPTTPATTVSQLTNGTNGSAANTSPTISNIPLASVISSTRQVLDSTAGNSPQGASQQATTRHLHQSQAQPTTTLSSQTRAQQQQPPANQLISIGTSQSQSISYTSQASVSQQLAPTTGQQTSRPQQQTVFQLSNGPSASHSSSAPLASSSSGSSSHLLATNPRLQASPSGWFAATSSSLQTPANSMPQAAAPTATTITPNDPQVAGSRLSSNQHSPTPADLLMSSSSAPSSGSSGAANNQLADQLATPPTAGLSWSSTGSSQQQGPSGLGAPANTPSFAVQGSNFGFRTAGNTVAGSRLQPQTRPTGSLANGIRQQQFASTSATTGNENQFIVAGSRLPPNQFQSFASRQQQQQRQPTTVSSASNNIAQTARNNNNNNNYPFQPITSRASLDDGDESPLGRATSAGLPPEGADNAEPANDEIATTSTSERDLVRITRQRRWAQAPSRPSASLVLDEFELSLGELLPNLRSLKLESFIDLSQASRPMGGQPAVRAAGSGGSPALSPPDAQRVAANSNLVPRPRLASGRFKRSQSFQPDDAPTELDTNPASMLDSGLQPPDADATSSANDPSSDSHSGAHHHDTLTSDAGTPSSASAATRMQQASRRLADIMDADVEPGEILWRSASGGRDSDDERGGGSPVIVMAPPQAPVLSASRSDQDQASSLDSGNKFEPMEGEQSLARVRHLSAVILQKLFSKLNKLRILQLTSNEIPHWPDQVLQDSKQSLARLYLISNNIRHLGRNSLANLTELQTLDLSSNQLRQLDANLFQDLTNLRQFRACRNLFRKLPLRLLAKWPQTKSMSRLESLDLSKNRYLSQFVWTNNEQLTTGQQQQLLAPLPLAPLVSLNLSDCSLGDQFVQLISGSNSKQSAVELLFASLPELTSVSLQNNKFRQLLTTANLFSKNPRLQKLDLSHNQLIGLSDHLFNANSSQLAELSLNHNQLREIPEQLLFNLRKLRRLSLAHNQIGQLSPRMFLTNQLIEQIDLSHNQLATLNTQQSGMIPFGNGANLKHLNLAHNNLSQFDADLFEIAWSFYTNLNRLDLSHNQFVGQISMPILYTIADEMHLNLDFNQIQSINVEALVQHEQVLDRYAASFEPSNPSNESGELQSESSGANYNSQTSSAKVNDKQSTNPVARVPTINIRLTGNPLACDCQLEPLISYSRRVAAATNPSIIASIFPQQHPHHGQQHNNNQAPGSEHGRRHSEGQSDQHQGRRVAPDSLDSTLGSLEADSRYSVLPAAPAAGSLGSLLSRQPQVLYHFKFNDVHCAQPASLQRRPLSHISIGDLLCPITDKRLCPSACQCNYQSAFRTTIVDCNGRQLNEIPHQLTNVANFLQFEVDSSFRLGSGAKPNDANGSAATRSISSVDKIIIRLDNNRLTSMDELSKLFQLVKLTSSSNIGESTLQAAASVVNQSDRSASLEFEPLPTDGASASVANVSAGHQRTRFARAPPTGEGGGRLVSAASNDVGPSLELDYEPGTRPRIDSSSPGGPSFVNGVDPLQGGDLSRPTKRKISPAAIARNMHQNSPGSGRNRRLVTAGHEESPPNEAESSVHGNSVVAAHLADGGDYDSSDSLNSNDARTPPTASNGLSVLESAEHYRDRRYSLTCELYLDHNSISSIPDSFLAQLDQVRLSSLQASLAPPQAALPTLMLEPPIHTKLNHHQLGAHLPVSSATLGGQGNELNGRDIQSPPRPSASSLVAADQADSSSGDSAMPSLFGAQGRHSLAADQKATLIETLSQNMRLQQSSSGATQQLESDNKLTVSPALVVLSLRHNNLAHLTPKTLHRLGKLIKSSNTKLYLGHNPFNCSDNFLQLQDSNDNQNDVADQASDGIDSRLPMGDQLMAASDSVSGAYLEPTTAAANNNVDGSSTGDLATSASETNSGLMDMDMAPAENRYNSYALQPTDCPVGQLKTWLTRHHSSIGDLDELYCVQMPPELAERLHLAASVSSALASNASSNPGGSELANLSLAQLEQLSGLQNKSSLSELERQKMSRSSGRNHNGPAWDHEHPWAGSSLFVANGAPTSATFNSTHLHKNGLTWNSELLMAGAKLIDVDLYDLCPYSNTQIVDPSALGFLSASHQQALISVAILAVLISLCLLVMLVYFGDTQTILAFVYIHMNPIYRCLKLNESHLDGEKLYDAFVSYSSADRDIVMQLIEQLEQPGSQFNGQQLLASGKGTNLDRSRDTLVTEADLRPDYGLSTSPTNNYFANTNGNGTLNRRSTSSFQDLTTMSRSTSRTMMMVQDGINESSATLNLDPQTTIRTGSELDLSTGGNGYQTGGFKTNDAGNSGQSGPKPYRLCIHERDWLPGHLISWNIVNSVQNSRRTILILSKEFIKSVWFQVEFHTAYYQMLEDKIDRLIVIVRGELPPKQELDKNLAFLLTTKTYLTWGEKWFWERLHYALPHRQGPPPTLIANKQQTNGGLAAIKKSSNNNKQQARLKERDKIQIDDNRRYLSTNEINKSSSNGGLFGSQAAATNHQKPLIMSSIGKDCSNLLLTAPSNNQQAHQQQASGSSSSSSASASSYLSGSSTNQLFQQQQQKQSRLGHNNQIITTSNDLLSTTQDEMQTTDIDQATTRLSVSGNGRGFTGGPRTSSPLADSGRVTATLSSSQSIGDRTSSSTTTTTSGGVTSIMLDGGGGGGANNNKLAQPFNPNVTPATGSKFRSKQQERLQSLVDKEISNHFNLSEL